MSDDNPYDDAADDDYDESSDTGYAADGTPLFGSASTGNPITDEAAYPESNGDPIVTINPENQPARTYKLTERVKEGYENAVATSLDRLDAEHYDMWWQDTTLHVEYHGCVRAPESRPGPDQSADSSNQKQQNQQQQQNPQQQGQGQPSQQQHPMQRMMQQMQQASQQGQQDFVLPREPRPPFSGRQGTVQVQMPVPQDETDDLKFFDEGLLPVSGFTEFDIQERAKRAPLAVEDVFVEPWSDDYPVQTPIDFDESEQPSNQEMFQVDDFRDETDSKDKKLRKGQRGNRYNL